jgi:MarR family transcriptional regulator, organic hydroperoxide resistance regulator
MDRITRLARLYPLLMGKMGRLRTVVHERLDLTYNQYKTLLTVADRGEGTLGDLARDLDVTMSSASQMVERLVGQGLIDRRQDADNRRQVRIRLTERGEELISELRQGILAEYRKLLARLPDAEQEDLVSSLETIARILGKINLDR